MIEMQMKLRFKIPTRRALKYIFKKWEFKCE